VGEMLVSKAGSWAAVPTNSAVSKRSWTGMAGADAGTARMDGLLG
jgi:hypothetical protein